MLSTFAIHLCEERWVHFDWMIITSIFIEVKVGTIIIHFYSVCAHVCVSDSQSRSNDLLFCDYFFLWCVSHPSLFPLPIYPSIHQSIHATDCNGNPEDQGTHKYPSKLSLSLSLSFSLSLPLCHTHTQSYKCNQVCRSTCQGCDEAGTRKRFRCLL